MAKIPTTQVFQKGSVWMYSPSLPPAILFLILYFFASIYITHLTFYRHRTWYLTVIPLGAFLEVAGYAVRIYSVKNQGNIAAFITTLTLHVLAPLLFAAGNYILLGRLVTTFCLPNNRHSLLKIPSRFITRLFVGFDVLAAAIQGSGTSIAASANWTGMRALTGVDVLVAGLAVQVAGVGVFLLVLGRFTALARGRRLGDDGEKNKGGLKLKMESGKGLVVAVWVSSVLIFGGGC
ncbi:RTA1 like protein-domain-containing protein [Cercophora samala]|uniref:RTA1 like protein-domain-containing protein n=1 Tax=Cercophora samala TaxID=330535 RepID=A0AA39ZAV6_9PEZI|nr:RTA1 like protein-domain-containing protein [Cercophora samala]